MGRSSSERVVNWNAVVVGSFAVAAGLLALAREWNANQGPRSRLKQELEILAQLPGGSAMRAPLQARIERNVALLVADDANRGDSYVFGWTLLAIVLFSLSTSFLGLPFIGVPVALLLTALLVRSFSRRRRAAKRAQAEELVSLVHGTSSVAPANDAAERDPPRSGSAWGEVHRPDRLVAGSQPRSDAPDH
jgi:hypothetical protein